MATGKTGMEFVKHEYDEAIAVQQGIVDAESELARSHPFDASKKVIKSALEQDRDWLKKLQQLGKEHGASGKREEVAQGLVGLMEQTLKAASEEGARSEYYEAHAVLLTLKRKQMDAAGGMRRIAAATKDQKLREAAGEFARSQRSTSGELARELAVMARSIASEQGEGARA